MGSDIVYMEDYRNRRDVVCYPFTLTDFYDTTQDMQALKYDYVNDHEKTKSKNRYFVNETPVYSQIKEVDASTNPLKYKVAFENQKGMMIGTDVTPEMALSKELEPIRSKKLYGADAKAALPHHNVDAEGQVIAHAMNMTVQASDNAYKSDYRTEVLGTSTIDPAIAYPELDRLKKIHDDTTKKNYEAEAKQMMTQNIYSIDAPEFARATESAINVSDKHYQKQKREAINAYRGYQTMDSRIHPDVVRGQKAHNLISDIVYMEDYRNRRDVVCYPFTLTDFYDTTQDMQALKYDYVNDHEKTKFKNRYFVNETPC